MEGLMSSFAPIRDRAGSIVGMQERGTERALFAETLAETMAAVGVDEAEPDRGDTPAPARRAFGRLELAGAAGGLLLATVLIAALNTFAPAPAPRLATPTAAATAAPTHEPTATPRMIVAYWAPDGSALSAPIAERDAHHFIGRQGDTWAQVRLPGGGEVWIERGSLSLDPDDLAALDAAPDLTPPTPRPTARSAAPPVEAPAPASAPAAAPCDPLNPPYQVRQQVGDLGHVVGFSCASVEEAQANADRLAAEMRQAAEPTAAAPTPAERVRAR